MHLSTYNVYLTNFFDYLKHCIYLGSLSDFIRITDKCPKIHDIPQTQTTYMKTLLWESTYTCVHKENSMEMTVNCR